MTVCHAGKGKGDICESSMYCRQGPTEGEEGFILKKVTLKGRVLDLEVLLLLERVLCWQ